MRYLIVAGTFGQAQMVREDLGLARAETGFVDGEHSLNGIGAECTVIVETDTCDRRRDWPELSMSIARAHVRGARVRSHSLDAHRGMQR